MKIGTRISFLILIFGIIIPALLFFHTRNQIVHLENVLRALSSENTLIQIWIVEITIVVTITTVLLNKTDKKLYGIELSKIITISDRLHILSIILFFVVIYTFILIVHKKMEIFHAPIIVLFYILLSLIALWFIISIVHAISYPEIYEKSAKKFYVNKIPAKKFYLNKTSFKKDFMMLIEENLCPYMYELIEKRNFGEYNRNFEFLIELFSMIRKSNYKEKSELLDFMEDKIYEVLKLTEIYLSKNLSNSNIKILNDKNYTGLLNLFYIPSNRQKEKKILDLARIIYQKNY